MNCYLEQDTQILKGLKDDYSVRCRHEKIFYQRFAYFIHEGCKKYKLSYDDSFSAYTDALLSSIHNIVENRFDGRSSLKTYLFQIFSNKCIDLVRKNATNKQQVHKTIPVNNVVLIQSDNARNAVEKLITNELKAKVKAQLGNIGEKCKEVLLMFEDGLSDKEIAAQLNYSNAAVVKTTRLRCLEKLREKVLGS